MRDMKNPESSPFFQEVAINPELGERFLVVRARRSFARCEKRNFSPLPQRGSFHSISNGGSALSPSHSLGSNSATRLASLPSCYRPSVRVTIDPLCGTHFTTSQIWYVYKYIYILFLLYYTNQINGVISVIGFSSKLLHYCSWGVILNNALHGQIIYPVITTKMSSWEETSSSYNGCDLQRIIFNPRSLLIEYNSKSETYFTPFSINTLTETCQR